MSIRDVLDPEMSRPWQENTLNFEFESPTISLPECKERKQNSLNHFFQNQNRSLFVRDLPFHTTAEVLREFIEKKLNHPDCVEDVLIRFSQQGKTLQVGCVLLRSESIIADALEKLHGCRFCGRDLRYEIIFWGLYISNTLGIKICLSLCIAE
jgi:RNA recognition motif-containing protein